MLGLRLTVSEERPLIARCYSGGLLWVAHVGARQLLDVAVLQPRTVGILVLFGVHVPKRRPQSRDWVCLRVARSNMLPLTDLYGVSPRRGSADLKYITIGMPSAIKSLIVLHVLS